MPVSEYEIVAVDATERMHTKDVCTDCIFSGTNSTSCLNTAHNTVEPYFSNYKVSLPDCSPVNSGGDSVVYVLAHKASGRIISAEDNKKLIQYYKGQNHE